jgi:hypothetical protein
VWPPHVPPEGAPGIGRACACACSSPLIACRSDVHLGCSVLVLVQPPSSSSSSSSSSSMPSERLCLHQSGSPRNWLSYIRVLAPPLAQACPASPCPAPRPTPTAPRPGRSSSPSRWSASPCLRACAMAHGGVWRRRWRRPAQRNRCGGGRDGLAREGRGRIMVGLHA